MREWISEDGRVRLINGDCVSFMRGLPDKCYELAVCDPPYQAADAIGLKDCKRESLQAANRTVYKPFDNIKPSAEYFAELQRVARHWIVWGGNYFGLSGGVIAWNKHGTAFGEGEVAICSTHKSVRFFDYTWNGMIQSDMKNKETRIHSCQKPISLYRYILANYAKEGDRIFDSHGGSMSSVIACHEKGFAITCCELDADYYAAGLARVQKAMQQQTLDLGA